MYAIIKNDIPEPITGRSFADSDGVRHSKQVLRLWPHEKLAAIGVYPVVDDEVPDGKMAVGSSLVFNDGVVRRVWELEDEPAETPEQTINRLQDAVQAHLDAVAQSRGYDHIISLCSYATSPHPVFGPEGQAGVAFRDAAWQACLEIMEDVQSEQRPVPTEQELIAELPVINWPETGAP